MGERKGLPWIREESPSSKRRAVLKIASAGASSQRNWQGQTTGVRWGEKVEPGATYRAGPGQAEGETLCFQQRRARLDLHLESVTEAGIWGTDRSKAGGKGSL